MATDIPAHSLFSSPDHGLLENVVLRHDGGIITSISEGTPPAATSPRSLVLPAFVNAHDHARPTASSFGALGMPLESWILRSALGTPVDPYLTAASAMARAMRSSLTSPTPISFISGETISLSKEYCRRRFSTSTLIRLS